MNKKEVITMLIIGSHVSFGGGQLLASTKEALSYGANTFMFYTGAPTNTTRKEIDLDATKKAQELMRENNIDINHVICHAPYIVNPATDDLNKRVFAISFLKKEIERCSQLGIKYLVLHPGSCVGIEREEGLKNIVTVLDSILDNTYDVTILLETMAGKGSECGITIQEIAYLINNVTNNQKLGVCLDTCHLNDAGYNMQEFDTYLDNFAKEIPLEKIGCIHINDSKNPLGTHKDRHANLGFGTIGFDTLKNIIYNSRLENIPKILETPYIGNFDEDKERLYPPYKFEIAMIKEKEFNPNILVDIRNCYKK